MMNRVVIVTTKQPGTNPRVRKSATALSAAGMEVHVLYAFTASWADEADQHTFRDALWRHRRIGGHPIQDRSSYLKSRLKSKIGGLLRLREWELCPALKGYIQQLQSLKPDLVIGHNPGSLPILRKWHRTTGGKVLFDAEDFHRGESYWVRVKQEATIVDLEDRTLPLLSSMTAASPLIADAYRTLYPQVNVVTVNNAFPSALLQQPPGPQDGPLKLIWFSQVLGLDRGLAEFLDGMSMAKEIPIYLTLVGINNEVKKQAILSRIQSPEHTLQFIEPKPEGELLNLLAQHEIGLALEIGVPRNRDICRTNKLYTYPLAGCTMLASETAAQLDFLKEWPETGKSINLTDPSSIADALIGAHQERNALLENRKKAWHCAQTTLNWEAESKPLVELVQSLTS